MCINTQKRLQQLISFRLFHFSWEPSFLSFVDRPKRYLYILWFKEIKSLGQTDQRTDRAYLLSLLAFQNTLSVISVSCYLAPQSTKYCDNAITLKICRWYRSKSNYFMKFHEVLFLICRSVLSSSSRSCDSARMVQSVFYKG